MIAAAVLASIFLLPTLIAVISLKLTRRPVVTRPLLLAGFAFLIYVLLLKSRTIIPVPVFLEDVPLVWFGKVLSLAGTAALIYLLPGITFRDVGLTSTQNSGSIPPVTITAIISLFFGVGTAFILGKSPDTALGNLLFQATMPGLDEELFMRGLFLLLLHRGLGKGSRIFGAETGSGFWIVVVVFGLLHGVTAEGDEVQINLWAIISTGYVGFVLTWMRERTGSLLIPILFHNLFNVAMAFV